jgi:hypothetical protein
MKEISRYELVEGMLKDPLTMLCVSRYIHRNSGPKAVPPPVIMKDYALFLTPEGFFLSEEGTGLKSLHDEVLARVYLQDSEWWVELKSGERVGPLASKQEAIDDAKSLLKEELGLTVVEKLPW